MTFAIIILFISVITAFGMIGRKLWMMRTGRVAYDVSYDTENWSDISVEEMRNELIDLGKYAFHHGILLALKLWIKTSNGIKMLDRKIREKLTHLLHKNGHLPPANRTSNFLRRISDHKNSIMSESHKLNTEISTPSETVENNQEIQ